MSEWIKTGLLNPVMGNLILFVVLIAGTFQFLTLQRETFPEFELDMIQIQVIYRGATPDEVEESVVTKIEEEITGIDGVEEIRSTSSEGFANIMVDVIEGYDVKEVKEDIEKEIDQILTFPEDVERPVITEVTRKSHAIYLTLYGDVGENTLKTKIEEMRDELLTTGDFSQIDVLGVREREISVELSEEKLQLYNLNFEMVSEAIRKNSLNLPGGTLRTRQGEILVRTNQKKYTGLELSRIPLIQDNSGKMVFLSDVAKIRDDFEEIHNFTVFNGKPAATLAIFKTTEQDLIHLCELSKKYAKEYEEKLPPNLKIAAWGDQSKPVRERLDMLTENGILGLFLVFLFLCFFMRFEYALWVGVGIPFSFLGTFFVMKMTGQTLNMISMFSLIIVLGMVVDDAMVVSESIWTRIRAGQKPFQAAFEGTVSVFWPIIGSVSTTVVAFAPFWFVEGTMGKFMEVLPLGVISVLCFSLFESLFILPAHLAHVNLQRKSPLAPIQNWIQRKMDFIILSIYPKILSFALDRRYFTVTVSFCTIVLALGLVHGGRVKFDFFPKIDQEIMLAELEFPTGTDAHYTLEQTKKLVDALYKTQEELQKAAKPNQTFPFIENVQFEVGKGHSGKATVTVEMISTEIRNLHYLDVLAKWRELAGVVPDSTALVFGARAMGPGGKGVELQLRGHDYKVLSKVRDEIRQELEQYSMVEDIGDNFKEGKLEAHLQLLPIARSLGFTVADVATQLRASYFGQEAMRIQRGKDDIRIYVRYPLSDRTDLASLSTMEIMSAKTKQRLPLSQVATLKFQRGYTTISHAFRQKEITITADIDPKKGNDSEFRQMFDQTVLSLLRQKYPGIVMEFRGKAEDTKKSLLSLFKGLALALLIIYAILASIFSAYVQPIIIMFAIPLGFVGAVLGHMIMGFSLTILSMFGMVALAGIVVNNSLILIEFINRDIRDGETCIKTACIEAGKQRFMAIFLTSMTTFLGVSSMLMEKSVQAQFLQPMVVSLAFGLVFSTVLTLFVIPALYMILTDVVGTRHMMDRFHHEDEVNNSLVDS